MSYCTRVLVAGGDAALVEVIDLALRRDSHVVESVHDGAAADRVLRSTTFDAVVVDLALPTLDGREVLCRMRGRGDRSPVIALATRESDIDAIKALDLGADDYLRWPLDIDELRARARALVRRQSGLYAQHHAYGGLRYDALLRTATVAGAPCLLSNREASVLEVLLQGFGKLVTKERLMSQVYGLEGDVGWNTLEVYIHRLRKKLVGSTLVLRTLHRRGYQLEPGSAPDLARDVDRTSR